MYHSIIPYEHILIQQMSAQDAEEAPKRIMTVHSGVTMEVSVLGDGRHRIERLYSTDPRYYLDNQFCVGTVF